MKKRSGLQPVQIMQIILWISLILATAFVLPDQSMPSELTADQRAEVVSRWDK